jgi:hypothetical protein
MIQTTTKPIAISMAALKISVGSCNIELNPKNYKDDAKKKNLL